MKKLILGTAIAALVSTGAYAQNYQFEVGADYVNGDMDVVDYDGFGLFGEVHLEAVDTSKGPLNEAAFLDKSSHVRLDWMTVDFDAPGVESVDADVVAVSGRFVTSSNLIIEAGYADLEAGFGNFDMDETIVNLGVGAYLNDTADLVVSFTDYDEADLSILGVDHHCFKGLSGDTSVAFDLGLAYIDAADDNGYGLRGGVDYYFNKALNVGAALALESVDDNDESTFTVAANYFVTPVVKLGWAYETLGQDADGDSFTLSAAVRF